MGNETEPELCGMIIGSEEQSYDGKMFNLKEFCVRESEDLMMDLER